ncbi:SDR family oxidoreductase [Maritalea sp. S77]|jgi:uncharacterized protein YbjT (DUF2867 family)|uniref:SDR family oxidoreductase n=1 Tax=Maritalea sp. S77 TaxID=3415125 RepID=UPI003C79973F
MASYLVTGATGNVGSEVLKLLRAQGHDAVAGVRKLPNDWASPINPSNIVDFEKPGVLQTKFDAIFLVRPPQLTDPALFRRLLDPIERNTKIVFLSVQGADKLSYLPHAKIEKVIVEMGFDYCFVRPSYFMENLATTLFEELSERNRVYLPAGNLKLDWISVLDVAELCTKALLRETSANQITASSGHKLGFEEVCDKINTTIGTSFQYTPALLFPYIFYMKRQNAKWSYIFVMLLLHYFPRLTKPLENNATEIEKILGRSAETIEEFALRKRIELLNKHR